MDYRVKIMEPEEIMEPLLGLLEEAGAVPLVISGSSMVPFLVEARDTAYLAKADRPLKRGDMAFYRRDNGRYILHRVYRVENGLYTMVGDAQTVLERGVRPDQIRALVTAVRRKGKLLKKGSFCWFFFERIWIRMVPLRPAARKAYALVKRLLGKK